jgi:hypothetical protein
MVKDSGKMKQKSTTLKDLALYLSHHQIGKNNKKFSYLLKRFRKEVGRERSLKREETSDI